ncbi:MAG: hypothetical protein AAFV19_08840, partial [Pseudomonadota bacterium]
MRVWGLRYLSYVGAATANLACALVVARMLRPVIDWALLVLLQDETGGLGDLSKAGADYLRLVSAAPTFLAIAIGGAIGLIAFRPIAAFGWARPVRVLFLPAYWLAVSALLALILIIGGQITAPLGLAIVFGVLLSLGFGFHVVFQVLSQRRTERSEERA